MRAQRMILRLAVIAGSAFLVSQAALADQYRGSFEQQLACTPDVWRLCAAEIPDADRIVACLRQNTPQLSEACREVFESNNRMPRSQPVPPPRGYGAPQPWPHGRAMPAQGDGEEF